MDRELQALPLDEGELLEQAKPDREGRTDPAKRTAREYGQVKAALAGGTCSFIILGGKHDLTDSVRRLSDGSTEYIRVTTKKYKEFAHEK